MNIDIEYPAPCIAVYKNCFHAENFINLFEQETINEWGDFSWKNSLVGSGNTTNIRTSLECDISILDSSDKQTPLSSEFKENILYPITRYIKDYKEEFMVETSDNEGWRILKYENGGEYHSHHDHSPNNSRVISIVAFLGAPEDGGELEFPLFNSKIKAENNTLVVFPSNFPYVHIAHPVNSGRKYSLVTWLR